MVPSWSSTKIVRKKYTVTTKDRNDWISFTKKMGSITVKEVDSVQQNLKINKVPKLDLHGFSLSEANKEVKKFIIESFQDGYKKLLIITGKGSKSKVYENPYLSEQMQVLKYSVPEFIKNDGDLIDKISKLSTEGLKDGGKGSFYIFLKKKKKL